MKAILSGKQVPVGEVKVSGAKNSATRLLAASLLSSSSVKIQNFPTLLHDSIAKAKFISSIGVLCEFNDFSNSVLIEPKSLDFTKTDYYEVPIRTTYLLAASGLIHKNFAKIPYPGGCKIGTRGYDLHIMVWEKMGCSVIERDSYIEVSGSLKGADIDFPISTVGGTENAIICGCVAKGTTTVHNAYVTPEILDLISFLRDMGAHIDLEGNSLIRIKGVNGLLGSTTYSVMPDRIEALTWLILAAASGGSMTVLDVPLESLKVPLIYLQEAGINLFMSKNDVVVSPKSISSDGIQPFQAPCGTHPGIHSDMQAFFVFLALFARGRSLIIDYRYPERIGIAKELIKMKSNAIKYEDGKIEINNQSSPLVGANVNSPDLRASMALLMAAICAEGKSTVNTVEYALRGYNNLQNKLENLGIECQWT